jgi:hypothetical protein
VALSSAHTVHNRNPLQGVTVNRTTAPALPAGKNHSLAHTPDTAKSGGFKLGIGNNSNIAVSQNTYEQALNRASAFDRSMAEESYNLSVALEEMCSSIYVVPETLPKFLEIVGRIKSSLTEFQTVTDEARMHTHQFVSEIRRIDGM